MVKVIELIRANVVPATVKVAIGSKKKHWLRRVLLIALLAFVALNAVAFRHAWTMTHFARAGLKTQPPEQLSKLGKLKVLFTGVSLPRPVNQQDPSDVGLKFETVRFGSSMGVELEAWRIPGATNGPIVVAFTGYGGAKDGLLPIAQELHGFGAEVWLVDFRGCGGSTGTLTTLGFHEADDVAATVRHAAGSNGRPLILFGTSMGAAAVLHAVHRGLVRPAGLILECPFDSLLATAGNRFRLMGLPAFPFAHLLVFWGGIQHGFNGLAHNPADYARSVHCPTLLLQGDHDTRVTMEQAGTIARNLGSNGRLVTFEGLAHESYVTAQPEKWRGEIRSFLLKTTP